MPQSQTGHLSRGRRVSLPQRPLDAQHGPIRRLFRLLFLGLARVAPGLAPRAQMAVIKAVYSVLSIGRKNDETTFLNFGYVSLDDDGSAPVLEPEDRANALGIQLYHRVAQACELRGRDVLEVGSGRGGGASFIARYLGPASMTGMDFAPSAVRFCRERHRVDGLAFVEGDAQRMPFPAASFDAVLNVESSHCYPSFDRFVREVARVLRDDGHFLFTDLRPRERVAAMREQLTAVFTVVEEEDITANVARALEIDSERRADAIRRSAPRLLQTALRNFAAVKGSPTYDALARGDLAYVRFVLRKPHAVHSD